MRTQIAIFFSLLFAVARSDAVDIETPKNQPVEITSTGETRYENGVAIARDNVAIHVGDTDIYADSARYDSQRHEISAEGHVRIYREDKLTIAEHGTYNLDTKEIHAETVRSSSDPYFVNGEKFVNFSDGHSVVENGDFTTDDSSNPDFHFHAHKVRVYENDRVVFQNVTFYIGKVPVFWWPYLYQSLNDAFSFTISPAYLSSWGPSLLSQITFPITDQIKGRLRLDYRVRRGVAIGFDSEINYGADKNSYLNLRTYFINDQNPDLNQTSVPRGPIGSARYRVSVEDRTNFTSDIYGIVNITKLSDAFVMSHSRTGSLGALFSAAAATGSGSACSIAGSMEGSITDSTAGANVGSIHMGEGNAGGAGAISVSPFAGTCSITDPPDDSSKST